MIEIKLFTGSAAVDDRGIVRFVNDFDFSNVKRFYQVENHRRGFIRAWHAHKKEGKYIYVPYGAALIGAVSLDTEKIQKFILCSELPRVLWVPPGYANGAMTLKENTIIQYFSTSTLEESKNDDIRFPFYKWHIWEEDYR